MKASRVDLLVNSSLFGVVTLLGLLVVELAILPMWATGRLDRDLALMGFYAAPNSSVGDTSINADGFTGTELSQLEGSSTGVNVLTLGQSPEALCAPIRPRRVSSNTGMFSRSTTSTTWSFTMA